MYENIDGTEGADSVQGLMDGMSYGDIQGIMDEVLGVNSFDFGEYMKDVVKDGGADTLAGLLKRAAEGIARSALQDRRMLMSLLLVALSGAVFSSFSKLMRGTQVSRTAFFAVYILFFSMLSASFLELSGLAADTLGRLADFMSVLVPVFMAGVSLTQGAGAAGIYSETALMLIAVVGQGLVRLALPAVNLYFFLRMADQVSQEEMFTKMAELVRDLTKSGVKAAFGLLMGLNVVQGLIVPVTAQVKNMALTRAGSALPGVGNAVGSVVQSVLCAGTLVKNAVGTAGMVVIFLICALPILNMAIHQFLYQLIVAVVQPVSDPRLVRGIGGMVDALKLMIYVVCVGAMLFITFIAVISAFTT